MEGSRQPETDSRGDSSSGGRSHAYSEPTESKPNGRAPLARSPGAAAEVREIARRESWDRHLPPRAEGLGWKIGRTVKRGWDVIAAAAGLVLLAPLLLLVAGLIALTSGRPVFYGMRAVGRRGESFLAYKFRTMVPEAEKKKRELLPRNEVDGPAFKMRHDPRVTPLGRVLRKYSIDELPQLWNVLKGEMSLVGPRPPIPEEFLAYEPWQRGRVAVTPGITGLWQIRGRSDVQDFDDWARMDLEYIERWSLWLDLKILVKTVPAVFEARGAY